MPDFMTQPLISKKLSNNLIAEFKLMSVFVLDITQGLGFLHKVKVFFQISNYLILCSFLFSVLLMDVLKSLKKDQKLLGDLNSLNSSVKFYNTFPIIPVSSNILFSSTIEWN